MCALPIVSGSEVSTPASTVPLDARPLREAALAPGRLAEAIGQNVGGLFQDVSQKVQDARNTRKIFDAERTMIQTKDNFLQDISKDPNLAKDPGTWVPAYQQRVQDAQDHLLNQTDLAPVVKRELKNRTDIWGASSISEVRTMALKREASDNYEAGMSTATLYLQNGLVDDAVNAYKSLNENGLMGPKELGVRIAQAPGIAAEATSNHILATAGDQAERVMKDQRKGSLSALTPKRYEVALKAAAEVTKRAQSGNAEELSGMIDDDPEHQMPKQAGQWQKSGKITSTQLERIQNRANGYAKERSAVEAKQETDQFQTAMMEADTAPTDPKALNAWAQKVKDNGLGWINTAYRRRLNEYVDRKVENIQKTGEGFEKPAQKDAVEQLRRESAAAINAREVIDRREGKYVVSDEAVTAMGGNPKDRVGFAESQKVQAAHQEGQLRQWFEDFPKNNGGRQPTPEEISGERQRILRPSVSEMVKAALRKGAKATTSTDAGNE